ncbi:MAG: HEAT repeat domain-containing protein, partial [Thermoflexales bacterium]
MDTPLASDSDQVAALLETALHDSGGESVEGAYVDHWVSNASAAIDTLDELFRERGFTDTDTALITAAIRDPRAPSDAVTRLLIGIKRWTHQIRMSLSEDPRPEIRAAAARADPSLFDPAPWLRDLADADSRVRREAIGIIRLYQSRTDNAQAHLRAALDDPDPGVRTAAAEAIDFYRDEPGAAALARRIEIEPERNIRKTIQIRIADRIARESIHVGADTIEARTGPELKGALLRALHDEDDEVRAQTFHAFRRWRSPEVASALFERLQVETSPKVRAWLVMYEGYSIIRERALPHLLDMLHSDPSAVIRTRVAFLMGGFGPETVPALVDALDDPGAMRAAAMTIGPYGALRALPKLMREWARPANRGIRRELESALRDTAITAAHAPRPPRPPNAQTQIQARIKALNPSAIDEWPLRVFKEDLNALPLHGNAVFLWALRPDGVVLRMDHEAFGHPTEPEADPLARFAVVAQGAHQYPELAEDIPSPPPTARPCVTCLATGESCGVCAGLGWR